MFAVVIAGASATKGAGATKGSATGVPAPPNKKLKIQVEPHQTIGHLKGLIANATTGLAPPFELQAHGTKKAKAYDDENTLSDCGLVSGSVVCVPLLDVYFVLPRGLYVPLTFGAPSK